MENKIQSVLLVIVVGSVFLMIMNATFPSAEKRFHQEIQKKEQSLD